MKGYKTIRCNNGVLRILCPDELGVKSITIVGPIKQIQEEVFQMNITQI